MARDNLFSKQARRTSDFEFNEEVAQVFDDMLARSIPAYAQQQQMMAELAVKFYQPGSIVYDLGCSTATTLAMLAGKLGPDARLVGYDNSEPMLEKARAKLDAADLTNRVDLRFLDLNRRPEPGIFDDAGVVNMSWTLQFVRPIWRDQLISAIYNGLREGGILIVNEKVLTNDSNINRYFIELYYDFKRKQGYSEEEISRKREALENILVPYRIEENLDLFRRNGFDIVETFFQWYNFAGFLCVKGMVR